jgi:hypothetical protein
MHPGGGGGSIASNKGLRSATPPGWMLFAEPDPRMLSGATVRQPSGLEACHPIIVQASILLILLLTFLTPEGIKSKIKIKIKSVALALTP